MHSYLITSKISHLQEQIKKHNPSYVLYRDKKNLDYDIDAKEYIKICSSIKSIKTFIHQKIDLAVLLGATGVHFTSNQFDEIKKAKTKGLEVIISTHSHEEVLYAESLGADAVTYGPIFSSPGKGEPKGIDDLKNLIAKTNIKVFALGGIINFKEVKTIKESEAYGFASIRYFS